MREKRGKWVIEQTALDSSLAFTQFTAIHVDMCANTHNTDVHTKKMCAISTVRAQTRFTRCVSPGLIVRREHSKMAASHKLLIIHGEEGRSGRKELRVENHLGQRKGQRYQCWVGELHNKTTGLSVNHKIYSVTGT